MDLSWAVFNCKFESAADHNDWPPCEFTCQDRRPVCWRCGNSGHCWTDCRQRPHEEMDQGTADRLIAKGWIQGKTCHAIINIGAWHRHGTARNKAKLAVHVVSGVQRDHPGREGGAFSADSGAAHFQDLGFVTDITDEFILRLNVLRACDMSVYLWCQVLWLDQEVTL